MDTPTSLIDSEESGTLILRIIGNDHTNEQSESDHASQENENMDINRVDLQIIFFSLINKKRVRFQLTGPRVLMRTSRISSQPLKDKTSKRASIAFPMLSKLNRRGFALKKIKIVN